MKEILFSDLIFVNTPKASRGRWPTRLDDIESKVFCSVHVL